jgi:hypothetical protein
MRQRVHAGLTCAGEGEEEAQVLQAAALLHHDQVHQAIADVAVPAAPRAHSNRGPIERVGKLPC